MLTGLIFLLGMFIAFAAGGAIVDYTPIGDLINYLTRDLPMNWVWSEHED